MIPILNVLWHIVAGERYDYKDARMTKLVNMLTVLMRHGIAEPDPTWFFPFLAKIFPKLEGSNYGEGHTGKPGDIKHFLTETIQHHKNTFDDNNIRDFIDAYLSEIQVLNMCSNSEQKIRTELHCRKEKKEQVSMSHKVMNSL